MSRYLKMQPKSTTSHSLKQICGAILISLTVASVASAQIGTSSDRGLQTSRSFATSDIETLNTQNGDLMLQVPLASLPEGRAGLSASVNLIYNSKLWDSFVTREEGYDIFGTPQVYSYNNLYPGYEGGWRYGFEYSLQLINRIDYYSLEDMPTCPNSYEAEYIFRLRVRFPDGSLHEFRPLGFNDDYVLDNYYQIRPDGWRATCNGVQGPPYNSGYARVEPYYSGTMTYYSVDGTYLRLDVLHDGDNNWSNNPWTLSFPDGRRVTGGNAPQRIYDRNNNYVEIINTTYNSHPATKIVDQQNRFVIIEYDGAASRDYIYKWGVNNEPLMWTVKWKQVYPYKKYGPVDDSNYPNFAYLYGPLTVVDQVIMPAQGGGLTYTFGYSAGSTPPGETEYSFGWGEVNSITMPSGAQSNYQYRGDNQNLINWREVIDNAPTRKDLTYQLEYDGLSTPTTETWLYNFSNPTSTITSPDGSVLSETYNYVYSTGGATWDQNLNLKTEQPDGTIVERLWQPNTPSGIQVPFHFRHVNACLKTEFTSIRDAAGNPVLTAIKDYNYDKNGNVTRVAEYDWVAYSSVPRNQSGMPTGIPAGASVIKVTNNTYHYPTPDSSDSSTVNYNAYHRPSSPLLRNAFATSDITNGAQVIAFREFTYDNPSSTGNMTQIRSWDSAKGALTVPLTPGNSNAVSNEYDQFGNVTLSTDALGVQTLYLYEPINGFAGLYLTEARAAINTPVQRTTRATYDFYSGVETTSVDADNNVTKRTSHDVFGRVTLIQEAYQTPLERRTVTEYNDAARRVVVRSDLNATGDLMLATIQHFDQLGRIRLSRQLENVATQSLYDETTGIKVQTRYRTSNPNSFMLVSNPYRAAQSSQAGAEATMGWARTKYDRGGRVVEVQSFAGTALPAPWGTNTNSTGTATTGYDGIYTTVTDQAGKARRSVIDALGRLVRVDEPSDITGTLGAPSAPTQPTFYVYDAQGNLKSSTQGAQTRTYNYSSLSRLTSHTIPELSATVSTTYDDNGNVLSTTGARGITKTYTYDQLNRLRTRSYSDGTPTVTYTYDAAGVPSSRGRLTSVSSSVSVYNFGGYDVHGRVIGSSQVTDGQSYQLSYGYDLAGHLTSETYPSGRVVTTNYDAMGRLSEVRDAAKVYANSFSYEAHGGPRSLRLGNNLWEHINYNSRQQPVQMGLGSASTNSTVLQIDYTYGVRVGGVLDTTKNNGNLESQTVTVPTIGTATGFAATQRYEYDQLNRLILAQENSGAAWKQTFTYDRYGNRRFDAAQTNLPSPLVDPVISPATNRIDSTAPGQGLVQYDNDGNLTADLDGRAYSYDAENRQKLYAGGPANGGASYHYDGTGRRVKAVVGNVTTIYVYNMTGQLVAEYSNTTTQSGTGTTFITSDSLGSPRVLTDSAGVVKGRHDYLPFGEEIGIGVGGRTANQKYLADNLRQKFTGKERDGESGLDYFGARYYSSMLGRFTSVDAAGPNAADPQTLNKYRYALNNPYRYVDPNGMYERNVHYLLTVALGIAAGFQPSAATQIGYYDQHVDDNIWTSPTAFLGLNFWARKNHHFVSMKRMVRLMEKFVDSPTFKNLGTLFHAFQDSYSHAGFGWFLGHALAGHKPDQTWRPENIDKAMDMAKATYNMLSAALDHMIAKGVVTKGIKVEYSVIEQSVREFLLQKEEKDIQVYFRKLIEKIVGAQGGTPQDVDAIINEVNARIAQLGTEDDPVIQEIRRSYRFTYTTLYEEEAIYNYRLRLTRGF
jgi:RHS repeat-associated protein